MTNEIISNEIQTNSGKLRWYHYVLSITSIICSSFVMYISIGLSYYNLILDDYINYIDNYPKLTPWHFKIQAISLAVTSLILTSSQIYFLIKKKIKAIITTFLILIIWIIIVYLSELYFHSYYVPCGEPY